MSAPARAGAGVRRERAAPRYSLTCIARRAAFHALDRLQGGRLAIRFPDGSTRSFGDGRGPALTVTVARDDLWRRIATRGSIGLGEAYVAGDWDASDLPAVVALLVRNAELMAARWPFSALVRARERRPHFPRSNGVRRARRHVAYHYDLGNDLFRTFLDDSLAYSCAYYEHPGQSLEEAQQAKMRRLCEKLAIGSSDRVLEIGCGWGGFAIHCARETGAHVTGVTISSEQHVLACERVREAGLDQLVEIVLSDYRRIEGQFTAIVSIEMFEAVGERQYGTFFATCERLLAPGGLVGLQTIAVPDQRWERYRRSRDWIQEYVFPGSLIPSLTAISTAMTRSSRLVVHGLEDIGPSYAETLSEWRRRFSLRADEVRRLGYDERFVRMWDYYLATCEALFATRSLRDLQLVLTRPLNDGLPRYPAARPTF